VISNKIPHDPGAARTLFASVLLLAVLLATLLLMGCSRTRTVTVPAQESGVVSTVPDTVTLRQLPPADIRGTVTMPERVYVVTDTPRYTVDLSSIEVDPEEETVTTRTVQGDTTLQKTWTGVPFGQRLRLQADSTGQLEGTVFGTPEAQEVEAVAESIEPAWYESFWTRVRIAIGFLGGLVVGYVVTKLTPFL